MNCSPVRPSGDPNFGETTFATDAVALDARPVVNGAAFRDGLVAALRDITQGAQAVVASTVQIAVVGPVAQRVPAPTWIDAGATRDGRTWTIRVRGQIASVGDRDLRLEDVNRAVARALTSATTWQEVASSMRARLPRDGGQLFAALQSSDACSGRINFNAVFAGGCTRLMATPAADDARPRPAPSPCATRTRSPFWLRPLVTFDHVGPYYPAGTTITVLADMNQQRGSLGIYNVAVGSARGFAALSAADLAGCPGFRPPPAPPPVPTGALPCGTFRAPRAFTFYEHTSGTDLAQLTPRNLTRGVIVEVYGDLNARVGATGEEFFVVMIRSGTYAGRHGVAALMRREIGCLPPNLPRYEPPPIRPAGNLAPLGGLPRTTFDMNLWRVTMVPVLAELRQRAHGLPAVASIGTALTPAGPAFVVYTRGAPCALAQEFPSQWRGVPVLLRQAPHAQA